MEIELKILEINVREVVARIRKLKPRVPHRFATQSGAGRAKKLFSGLVRTKYFDFTDGRIRKKRDLLRLREFIPQAARPALLCVAKQCRARGCNKVFTELVYKVNKGVKRGCKQYEELEYRFEGARSFKELAKFLLELGLRETCYFEKRRTLFSYKNLKFEIDEYPRIPPFLEIEGPDANTIKRAVKMLGLQKYEKSAFSIGKLLKTKYPKIRLEGLTF